LVFLAPPLKGPPGPDGGPLMGVPRESGQQGLETAERIGTALAEPRRVGGLQGFDSPASLLPSAAVQRARQQAIPDARTLRGNLARATLGQSNLVTARDVANTRQVVVTTAAMEKLEAALSA